MRMALTGHLVFSTLHTNDAATAVTRLVDMGVEPFLIASAVQGFIAQRLVRTLCPNCKRPGRTDADVLREFEPAPDDLSGGQISEGAGCEACHSTGFQGRTAIYEILPVRASIKELILQRASADQIRAEAVRRGMRTLRQDGWAKILLGLTTPAEVLRVTQTDDPAES
jgi:type II secretory ATPase GspE/PulE/Tfp pilus assembly ATPase PilB-like protein